MITQNPIKWEYKVVHIQTSREASPEEFARAGKVADLLNKDGQANWELISTIHASDSILPEGFVVLKRQYQAPAPAVTRRFGVPSLTAAKPKVVPPVAKPVAK